MARPLMTVTVEICGDPNRRPVVPDLSASVPDRPRSRHRGLAARAHLVRGLPMTCDKVAYATKNEAKAAKRSCQQAADRGASKRRESRIYRCHLCGAWHLTSVPHRDYQETVT